MVGKIFNLGQSAGKILIDRSSETTRETYNNTFIQWLIGFTDGSFIVNKNVSLEFKITQSSNDAQIL